MPYLDPSTIRPANLATLGPLTLLRSISSYDETFLVAGDPAHAIFLGGSHIWHTMPVEKGEHWSGLAIPDVRIEADVDSAFDLNEAAELGALVREGGSLEILASGDRYAAGRFQRFSVHGDDMPLGEARRIGFRRWRIVRGDHPRCDILHTVDLDDRKV